MTEYESACSKIISSEPFNRLAGYAQTSITHYLVPFAANGAPLGDNIHRVNRKEHSICTYLLVNKFFEYHPELKGEDCEAPVIFAALCHDIGVVAASHYNDPNLPLLTGIENHEQRARIIMQDTKIKDMIADFCRVDDVARIIEGRDAGIGCIVNNGNHAVPDADSIHNLMMYIAAYVNMDGQRLPDPIKLVEHAMPENGVLSLDDCAKPEYDAYNQCRKTMYGEIHGEWHTSVASILTYSLGHMIADKGKRTLIDDGFLDFVDKELIDYLKTDPLLCELIGRTQKGILPVSIAEAETSTPSGYLMTIHRNLPERYKYSNNIAKELGGNFKPGDITVEVSKLKSRRGMGDRYSIRVFADPRRIWDFNASKRDVIDFEDINKI
ncbi:MAG: hypothetical protein ABIG84_00365 [archaeon]